MTNEVIADDDEEGDTTHITSVFVSDDDQDEDTEEQDEADDDSDLDAIKAEQVRTLLMPTLEKIPLPYRLRKSRKGVTLKIGSYLVSIGARRARNSPCIYTHEKSLRAVLN